ncbi:unannotated protein [freshwater metagenome]|uniref:Unannotated protein n=1 Tax=freshwater metagenome TaxID=449393 RepID=A0A6J7PLW6_9ZZZZ
MEPVACLGIEVSKVSDLLNGVNFTVDIGSGVVSFKRVELMLKLGAEGP